jgi:GTP cyclohydrolase I
MELKMRASIEVKETTLPVRYLDRERGVQELVWELIDRLGEDPARDGLFDTPERVERSLRFLTSGYREHPEELLRDALFEVEYDEMVLVKDIELYSLCEHHLLPFFGKSAHRLCSTGKVIGLSKVARVVDVFARRFQVQERLTTEIAEAIEHAIRPLGVAVVIEAQHFCMMMRGVQKQESSTVTSCMRGSFRNPETRVEFLRLIRKE